MCNIPAVTHVRSRVTSGLSFVFSSAHIWSALICAHKHATQWPRARTRPRRRLQFHCPRASGNRAAPGSCVRARPSVSASTSPPLRELRIGVRSCAGKPAENTHTHGARTHTLELRERTVPSCYCCPRPGSFCNRTK